MIYGIVNTVRNGLFDLKFWKSKYYSKPTIGVGNLSMGGTGKSVVVTYLIALLKKEHPIAVLSRGYKRLTKGFVLADKKATAKTIGDEPYQFFKKNGCCSRKKSYRYGAASKAKTSTRGVCLG